MMTDSEESNYTKVRYYCFAFTVCRFNIHAAVLPSHSHTGNSESGRK